MRNKTLVVLSAVAILGVSSADMARGGGGHGMAMHGHGHFVHHFNFRRHFVHNFRFGRNPLFLSGWGWGGDWGWGGYGNSGGGSTTVVAFPQATPAGVTGSIPATPCHLNAEKFTVPSSAGGTREVQIVGCR
jgi:hypothetical protein